MKNLKRLSVLLTVVATLGAMLAGPVAAQTAAVFVFRGEAETSPLFLPDASLTAPNGDYRFDTSNALPDQFCIDAGVVNGQPALPDLGGCSLHSDGGLYPNALGVGPSCGMSQGDEVHSENWPVPGEIGTSNFTSSNGSSFSSTDFGWITSAGGTIPFTASSDDGDLVALVQAQGGSDCAGNGAQAFAVIGVGTLVGA